MSVETIRAQSLAAVVATLCIGVVPSVLARDASSAASQQTLAAERLSVLDQTLQRYVDEQRIAGAVALVLKDGEVAYNKAFGMSDREANRRMSTDTLFRIASQTKAITSAAAMMLVDEGKLGLSNPVSQFIPAFANSTVAAQGAGANIVPATRTITVRDLLTHTSGYSYGRESHVEKLYEAKGLGPAAGNGWYFADKSEPICTSIERLASLPAVSQPGEAYVYGYSTDILGCVIERASGMSLEAFMQQRVFKPLGMKDTHFYVPQSEQARLAAVYGSNEQGKIERSAGDSKGQGHYFEGPRRSFSGGAGLVSTAQDYARFLEMIRNEGTLDGVRYLSPRAVALMRTNQIGTLHSQSGLGFGYGFQTTDRYGANGMDAPGAFGWGGAYGTIYRVDPQSGLVLVLMLQLMPNSTDLREKFLTLVYQALDQPPTL